MKRGLTYAEALEYTGTVNLVVDFIAPWLRDLPPFATLIAVYFLGLVMTEILSNNAVAVLLTPVAIAQGRALAERLFAGGTREVDLSSVATAVFMLPPLATIGLTEAKAREQGLGLKIFEADFRPMKQAFIDGKERCYMKLLVDAASDRVVGIHMLGADAPEIMQSLAVAVSCGATKAQFDRTIAMHPTAAEEFVLMREPSRVAG